jgi:beta-lactamase class A
MNAFESVIKNVPGITGVSARHFSTGKGVQYNSDTVFFTASTLKVPLLVELYRQVDQGKLDLGERVNLTNGLRVPGSGVLKELGEGLQPALHDLATLMIIISDNSATDILYRRVGRENIDSMLKEFGLTRTRIPMTTRELLYSIVGLDPENPTHTYQMASDKLVLQQFVMDADGFSEARSDVSSPEDMVRLLELVYRGEVLSPSSREGFFNIMKRQQLNTILPLRLPTGVEAAHKTGGYHGVRCDVGIVYAPNGPYAVAIMAKQVSGLSLEVDLALSSVSKAVYDELAS